MKLMILDGNSIVNRAYYGVRMLNAPDGTPTNAVFGFLAILQRLLDAGAPDALCVAFDLAAPTFRHMRYEGYKAQRKPMPDELAAQMPVLKSLLAAMGVKQLSAEGWEADDILGTVARICEESGWDCDIVTGDRDSFQLISAKTEIIHINVDDILYIESFRDTQSVYFTNKEQPVVLSSTMAELEGQLLKYSFIRIHKSILVNAKYVSKVNGCEVVLNNGKVLYTATKRAKQVRDEYMAYNRDKVSAMFKLKK